MSKYSRRGLVRASGVAAALATLGSFAGRAGAQGTQPLDTVKIVTGFPPGGTTDTLSRRVAEHLRGGLCQDRTGREQAGRGRPDRRAGHEGCCRPTAASCC